MAWYAERKGQSVANGQKLTDPDLVPYRDSPDLTETAQSSRKVRNRLLLEE